jgi:type VI secretion system secreted protein Hcp
MALDAFVKFEGPEIEGGCTVPEHDKELQIMSYSWGLSNPTDTHLSTGSGAAKANVQDVSCTMNMDKAWPNLIKFCQNGRHFEKVTLYARKAAGVPGNDGNQSQVTYKKMEMENVIISSVQDGASDGSEFSSVHFSLNFGKYKITYTPQASDGTSEAEIPTGWDIAKNEDYS